MKMRLGVFSGLAVGYVLGTKAGRERYEQLRDLGRRIAGSDAGQQLQAEARQAKDRAGAVIGGKTSEGVAKVSELISSDDDAPAGTTPPSV
jgi:tryptophan synthase beta subunit